MTAEFHAMRAALEAVELALGAVTPLASLVCPWCEEIVGGEAERLGERLMHPACYRAVGEEMLNDEANRQELERRHREEEVPMRGVLGVQDGTTHFKE